MTDAQPEVRVAQQGRLGRLTLNRPKALHALTEAMCATMIQALLAWRDDPAIDLVLLDHAGPRGFCAGGDIRMLAQSGLGDGAQARSFFATEYRLNHLLFTYPKPVIAFMDGLVMGGGAGVALPCRYRIATENTVFAMPETGIGLFPDVGGGWHLPRLPGKAGLWLALTGARLGAADCLALGLATHHVESGQVEALKTAIRGRTDRLQQLDQLLARFDVPTGPAPFMAQAASVDRLFAGDSVEAILAALRADGSAWAMEQLQVLSAKSPQSLKVAYRQLALGAAATDFAEHMAMEFRIGARLVHRHDFLQGVRAVIVAKDNDPRWFPTDLAAVPEAVIDQIFAPLPTDQEWTPLGAGARA
jgi:enoyl-CoA hydratase